ncbi:MAG: transcriptional regulator [Nitrospirae bacterium]|nr:transcriptional regulator [Nitrospirota bacterium]
MAEEKTIRQEIKDLLMDRLLTSKDISKIIRIKEKDVIDHLNHIAISVGKKDFIIEPSICMKCGFVFNKRERLTSPSRCPVCKHEGVSEPRFGIKKED